MLSIPPPPNGVRVEPGGYLKGHLLVEESKEVSHDHDDHAGQCDEDLLDLMHPLSWVLQFYNIKVFQGACHPQKAKPQLVAGPTS